MGFLKRVFLQAMRIYLRIPLISGLAVVSLTFGICVATTVFSLLDTVLLKPLAFRNPQNVVLVWRQAPTGLTAGNPEYPWGMREFLLLREEIKTLQAISAFKPGLFVLTNSGEPITLEGIRATPSFFSVFDEVPVLGRGFSPEESHSYETVLSYDLWRTRFGGSDSIVGRSIDLNGHPFTIVGVMPRDFRIPESSTMPGIFELPARPQLWVSTPLGQVPSTPGALDEMIIAARLHHKEDAQRVRDELNLFSASQNRAFPAFTGWFASKLETYQQRVSGRVRTPLLLIELAVLMVVAICCVNVANLLLVLSFSRKAEFSVRSALGATPLHILKQIVLETSLLSLVAGVGGVLMSYLTISVVRRVAPPNIPRLNEATLDFRVFVFALGLTALCALGTGVIPALWAIKGDLFSSLREGQRTTGGKGDKTRDILLSAQIALAFVLVVATGLLGRTINKLASVDPGFASTQRVSFHLYLPGPSFPTQDSEVTALRELEHRFEAVYGVKEVGIVSAVPMGDIPPELTTVRLLDRPAVPDRERPFVNYSIVSPTYRDASGILLIRGRDLSEQDSSTSPRVAIINQTMAKRFWPGGDDPIGKSFDYGSSHIPPMTIVGVIGDVKHKSLREVSEPEVYVPYTQHPWSSMQDMQFIVRADPRVALNEAGFSDALHAFNKGLSIDKYSQWDRLVADSMKEMRFAAIVITAFGFLSLGLAAVGIYGVMAFAVERRTREIGIRMAVGSQRSEIFLLILRYGVIVAAYGLVAGVIASAGAAFLMRHYLFGVPAWDPVTFCLGLAIVLLVTVGACSIPARKAMAIEPMIALRQQ